MSLKDCLRNCLSALPGNWIGTTEEDSDRDGFLSTYAEAHALGLGFYAGMRTTQLRLPTPGRMPDIDAVNHPDVEKERPYFVLGFVLGTGFQLLLAYTIVFHLVPAMM